MNNNNHQQIQFQIPHLTPIVKKLVIINLVVWVVGVLIVQRLVPGEPLFSWFGLIPDAVLGKFTLWQFFSYCFIHSNHLLHVMFNMLILWWLGSELERRWGSQFFLTYYLVCGVGAGLLYFFILWAYSAISGDYSPMLNPVVGASGAIYGLLLAYGIVFGESIIYFFMVIPMKAKYFVMVLGAMELLTLLSVGFSSNVANLAHLGGIVVGLVFLLFRRKNSGKKLRKKTSKFGRNLKLVVNNDVPPKDPKYWN